MLLDDGIGFQDGKNPLFEVTVRLGIRHRGQRKEEKRDRDTRLVT